VASGGDGLGVPGSGSTGTGGAGLVGARFGGADFVGAPRGRDEVAAPPAPVGRDGRYTVQVISYETRGEAAAFAAALRARGYGAFVMSAEVPGRGTMHRVRVGPFENLRSAEAFRREFEERERMATMVVRRPDDARAAAE
jgi:hypothetical protein